MGGGFEDTWKKITPAGILMGAVKDVFKKKESPQVQTSASEDVAADQKKAAAQRSRLLATSGGISGAELEAGTTTKRDSIFGNA
jgi:hypothetical protein